jgi:hypothetical protein
VALTSLYQLDENLRSKCSKREISWARPDVFLVEAMVCGPCESSVAEVIKFMSEAGYHLIDITEPNRSPKYCIQGSLSFATLSSASYSAVVTVTGKRTLPRVTCFLSIFVSGAALIGMTVPLPS